MSNTLLAHDETATNLSQLREEALLVRIGDRIRKARTGKRMSRRALSEHSGVSQRYLAQLESGVGNISVLLLHRVAEALGEKIEWLVKEDESRLSGQSKARRLAFIGLRGAGKSTLGQMTAKETGLPFLELNEEIEEVSGMPIHEVMALYGNEGYRRLEMKSLKKIVKSRSSIVLAVAGGIVSEPETYRYLLQNCFTIWLKAQPEDHMNRVRSQGDERPMAGNPGAINDLRKILISREPLYAQADAAINTSGKTYHQSLADVLHILNHRA